MTVKWIGLLCAPQATAIVAAPSSTGKLDVMSYRGAFASWVKTLTKDTYRISGIDVGSLGFATGTYGMPRTYGAAVRMES